MHVIMFNILSDDYLIFCHRRKLLYYDHPDQPPPDFPTFVTNECHPLENRP